MLHTAEAPLTRVGSPMEAAAGSAGRRSPRFIRSSTGRVHASAAPGLQARLGMHHPHQNTTSPSRSRREALFVISSAGVHVFSISFLL